jgi:hypothetical protein
MLKLEENMLNLETGSQPHQGEKFLVCERHGGKEVEKCESQAQPLIQLFRGLQGNPRWTVQ